jgi:prepilin peptidase CpaA
MLNPAALGSSMHSLAWWPVVGALAVATVSDIRCRRIPNVVVAPLLVTGIVASVVLHGWRGLGQSLLGVAMATLILGILYCLGGMGMGDVKLFAAIGAWIWPAQLTLALMTTAMAGGVMAVIWALCGGYLNESFQGAGYLLSGAWKRGAQPRKVLALTNPGAHSMPFAPAIAIGTIVSFLAVR